MVSAEDTGDAAAGETLETPGRLERLPSRLLAIAAAEAERVVGAGLAAADSRKWHYAVLASLGEFGPASQAALSRRTGIYRSDMVGLLNELAERGLIERTPDPDDRRRNVVTLTELGRSRLHDLDAVQADLQDQLLTPLSTNEREQLVEMLLRLREHHARTSPDSWGT
ncbi:MarR family winged helix-turn-helix transcriptional regulator [Actinocorallia sp. A-T 12471]|uniref:MarR family winged helix-turn-helix transcriptional regulator n=1 Tax=Actinocorallia sp. A-T 12471 TaxID=3089813 RepID=UPI0029D1E1BF|nr:MarR family transcriptional regulator [Actinocorallia sp. A-T 12471]MDX6741366.1 MarR family transcriptional regulator [Actinocorallia sp. A-T 12471]